MTEIDTSTKSVERFDCSCDWDRDPFMESDPLGDYVRYEDYAALAAERDALKRERDDLAVGMTTAYLSGAEDIRRREVARANALVAAAYEAAAATLALPEDAAPPQDAVDQALDYQRRVDTKTIRALTPSDARAALDRMLAEAVEKERERCAEIADKQAWAHGGRYFDGPERNSERIAAAIREGETP